MNAASNRRRPTARALAGALALALSASGPLAQAQVRLPALGDAGTEHLSVGDERRLGQQIMREARRDPDFLDDPVLLAYVQSIWQPLVAAARQRGDIEPELARQLAFELFLVRDRAVNAFAWPGGYVGVHLALIALTTNRDQLASVLAHELSHVTQRHIARSMGNAQNASLIGLAAILLGILAASRSGNADMANAAIMTGQGVAAQGQLNFSREMEREADRIGYAVLAGAGFATGGMAQMFERLDSSATVADSGAFPYLRTHPLTLERISEARNRVLLAPDAAPRPTLQHALMQARARVLMDKSTQSLQRWAGGETSSAQPGDRTAALYAGALALLQLGQSARAEAMAADALRGAIESAAREREPEAERSIALLQVQARLAGGDGPGALAMIDSIERQAGTPTPATPAAGSIERVALVLRAESALAWRLRDAGAAASALRQSTENLQTWVAEHPSDARAWELLAGTAEAIGQKLRAMRAAAEARAVLGDHVGAIDRLRAAQAIARQASAPDFIEASVIDARLRQLQAERRQILLEARNQRGGGPGGDRDGNPPQFSAALGAARQTPPAAP